MFQPKNLYSVLTPMHYTLKLFGLAPFQINSKGFKSSKINLVWSIWVIIFLNTYTSIGLNGRPENDEPFIANIADMLAAYLTQLSMFCGIVFGCIYRKKILNAIEDINQFDQKVNKDLHVNLKKEYRKSKIYLIILLFISICCIISVIVVTSVDSSDLFTMSLFGEFLAYIAPEVINSFVEFEFCTLILCLKQRFGWLNNRIIYITHCLEKNLCEYDNIFSIKINKKHVRPATHIVSTGFIQDRTLDIIDKIRLSHHTLCAISRNLNQAYSIQILFIIMQIFITILVLLYYAGKRILEDDHIQKSYIIYCFGQIGLVLLQVVTLVKVCSTTVLEARETAILIHNIISVKLQNKCKEDLQYGVASFSLQSLHQNVTFTACSIFTIDETLLFTIIGAITTYLVIVIQLELGDSRTLNHNN